MAKFLKKFLTHLQYDDYMDNDPDLPNVSICDDTESEVHYNLPKPQTNSEIWYTTTDGNIISPWSYGEIVPIGSGVEMFGVNMISNTYKNGKGVMKFDGDVTLIGPGVFAKRAGTLESISLPSTVTTISGSSFLECIALTGITIPENVTIIDTLAFRDCISLKEVTMPEGVITIGDQAFQGCEMLTEITIPEGVSRIGEFTFANDASLNKITIPPSVVSIGASAFQWCSALTSIVYTGTRAQWNNVNLASYWNNRASITVIHCSDGDSTRLS